MGAVLLKKPTLLKPLVRTDDSRLTVSGNTFTRSTSAPSGGNDGDLWMTYPSSGYGSAGVPGGKLYLKTGGSWKQIGRHADWLTYAAANGWILQAGYAAPPQWDVSTTKVTSATAPTISGSLNISFGSPSAANVYVYERVYPSGQAVISGSFQIGTLPAGSGAVLEFGCGNFYLRSYPFFQVNATTKAVSFNTTSTGVTAQADDMFWIASGPGFAIAAIMRAGATIWNSLAVGDFYTMGWGEGFGKCWYVGSTGTLTAGSVASNNRELTF